MRVRPAASGAGQEMVVPAVVAVRIPRQAPWDVAALVVCEVIAGVGAD